MTGPWLAKRTAHPRPGYIGLMAGTHCFGCAKKTCQQNQIGDDLKWKKLQRIFQVKVLGAEFRNESPEKIAAFLGRYVRCFVLEIRPGGTKTKVTIPLQLKVMA